MLTCGLGWKAIMVSRFLNDQFVSADSTCRNFNNELITKPIYHLRSTFSNDNRAVTHTTKVKTHTNFSIDQAVHLCIQAPVRLHMCEMCNSDFYGVHSGKTREMSKDATTKILYQMVTCGT